MHRRALSECEESLGPSHADTMASAMGLAAVLEARRNFEEAEALLWRELAWREGEAGPSHHAQISQSVRNLARFLETQGRHDETETLYRRSVENLDERLGAENPEALGLLSDYARLLEKPGTLDEAESIHRHVLKRQREKLGAEHHDTLVSMDPWRSSRSRARWKRRRRSTSVPCAVWKRSWALNTPPR